MSWFANITVKIKQWWADYKRDVAIARKRQKMLRLIRDKSYAHEKGKQKAKTEGHRARQPRRYADGSLLGSTLVGRAQTHEPMDAIGTLEPMDAVGSVDDIFKAFREDRDEKDKA